MSASQDNLLNQEVNEAQGDILLDQLVHSGEDSSDDVLAEYVSSESPEGPKFNCEKRDLYGVSSITNSQTLSYAEAPTQEDIPVCPGTELQLPAHQRYGQDIFGQGDQVDPSPLDQESLLGQRDSKEMELGPHQFEPSELDIQNFVQEMREKSNLPDISDASGLSSNS